MVELSNDLIRFAFDELTGSVAQITDARTGRDFLSDPRGSRLLRLVIPTKDIASRSVSTSDCGNCDITRQDDSIIIHYPRICADDEWTGVSAEVAVRLPEGSEEALFSVEMKNDGPDVVHEVHFPWIGGWTGFAGKGADTLTTSLYRADPHTILPTMRAWTFGRANRRIYLGSTIHNVPMLDISGGGRGISYNLYTSKPRVFGLVIEDLADGYSDLCLSWAWVGFPFLKPGGAWQSPEVGVGVHQGDWHETADRLRKSISSWWKAPPIPEQIRDSIGYFNIQFTGHNGESCHDFSEIPAIAQDCVDHGVRDLCIWDYQAQTYVRHDDDGYQWKFSPEQESALRGGLAAARELGCHCIAYADFWLTTEGSRVWKELSEEAVVSFYGRPIPTNINVHLWHANWRDETFEQGGRELCQKSPRFRQFALDLVRRTLDLGFDSIFIDGGSAWRLCHSEKHGHASPDDTVEGAFEWMSEASRIVKRNNSDGYLIGEAPESFNSQILDLYTRWWSPSDPIDVYRYALPHAPLAYPVDENDPDLMLQAFARGLLLSLMTTNLESLLSDCPEFADRARRLADLRKRTAPFVARGAFRDNVGLTVEGGVGYVFTSEAGLAVTIANPEPEERGVEISVDPAPAGMTLAGTSHLHVDDGSVREIDTGALRLELTMSPYSAAVWCIPREQ